MESAIVNYKTLQNVKDDKFDVDQLQHYNLALQIGPEDFQLCIFDTKNYQCLLLEDYAFEGALSSKEVVEILSHIWENHHLLLAGFWKSIKVSFKNLKFVQVPAPLFEHTAAEDYLKMNCPIDNGREELFYYQHLGCDAVTVFAADKEILAWLRKIYPAVALQVIHHTCSIIEGVIKHDDHFQGKSISIYVRGNDLTIMVTHNKKLLFINKYKAYQLADFIRYSLLVMQELELDQHTTKVILRGKVEPQSGYFLELYKYVRNLSFGNKPSFLKFGFAFDELPEQQYFDIYSTYLCD